MTSLDINPSKLPKAAASGTKEAASGLATAGNRLVTGTVSVALSPFAYFAVAAAVAVAWNAVVLDDGDDFDLMDILSVLFITHVLRRMM